MDLINLLQKAGLKNKEAKAYLACLELGAASVQAIAQKSGLKRTTTYDVVESLLNKGFIIQSRNKKRKVYVADDPKNILNLLKLQQEKFKQALPELKSIFNRLVDKPKIEYYEGVAGLETVYNDTLESKGTILAYGSIDNMWSVMSKEFIKKYVEERVKRNIFERAIVPATKEAKEYARNNKKELREFRFVDPERVNFYNEINIYNDKVAIISFRDKIGLIIQSQQIADTQKAIFELAWQTASLSEI